MSRRGRDSANRTFDYRDRDVHPQYKRPTEGEKVRWTFARGQTLEKIVFQRCFSGLAKKRVRHRGCPPPI